MSPGGPRRSAPHSRRQGCRACCAGRSPTCRGVSRRFGSRRFWWPPHRISPVSTRRAADGRRAGRRGGGGHWSWRPGRGGLEPNLLARWLGITLGGIEHPGPAARTAVPRAVTLRHLGRDTGRPGAHARRGGWTRTRRRVTRGSRSGPRARTCPRRARGGAGGRSGLRRRGGRTRADPFLVADRGATPRRRSFTVRGGGLGLSRGARRPRAARPACAAARGRGSPSPPGRGDRSAARRSTPDGGNRRGRCSCRLGRGRSCSGVSTFASVAGGRRRLPPARGRWRCRTCDRPGAVSCPARAARPSCSTRSRGRRHASSTWVSCRRRRPRRGKPVATLPGGGGARFGGAALSPVGSPVPLPLPEEARPAFVEAPARRAALGRGRRPPSASGAPGGGSRRRRPDRAGLARAPRGVRKHAAEGDPTGRIAARVGRVAIVLEVVGVDVGEAGAGAPATVHPVGEAR
jgi:hypothetical protein